MMPAALTKRRDGPTSFPYLFLSLFLASQSSLLSITYHLVMKGENDARGKEKRNRLMNSSLSRSLLSLAIHSS